MKAYLYVRFSTQEQAAGDSERRQMEAGLEWAKANGATLEVLQDNGVSAFRGRHMKNGELGKFVERLKRGQIPKGSVLLVESLDRLSRERESTALRQLMDIVESGMDVVDLRKGKRYNSQLGVFDIMEALMDDHRAHQESVMRSKRIGAAWAAKRERAAEQPMSRRVPWGYKVTGMVYAGKRSQGGQVEIDPSEGPVVRELFGRIAKGESMVRACLWLNSGEHKPQRAQWWTVSTLKGILTRRCYVGELRRRDGSMICPSYYPQLVPMKTFDRVQAQLAPRAGKKLPHRNCASNLTTGLFACSRCGNPVVYVQKGGGSRRRLVCSAAKAGRCEYHTVNLSDMELSLLEAVLEADGELQTALASDKDLQAVREAVDLAEGGLKRAEKRADRVAEALVSLGTEAGNNEVLKRQLDKACEAVEQAKADLAEARRAVQAKDADNASYEQIAASIADLCGCPQDPDLVGGFQAWLKAETITSADGNDRERQTVKAHLQRLIACGVLDCSTGRWTATTTKGLKLKGKAK